MTVVNSSARLDAKTRRLSLGRGFAGAHSTGSLSLRRCLKRQAEERAAKVTIVPDS